MTLAFVVEMLLTTKEENRKAGSLSPASVAFVCVFCVRKGNHHHRKHRPKPHRKRIVEGKIHDFEYWIGSYALADARASDMEFRIHHSSFIIHH